jgi:hypothetical protein
MKSKKKFSLILWLHYSGEKGKLLFRTTGVFMLLLLLIAAFQATGISFFLAKLFTGKAMEILRVAFNFVPKDTYQFALVVSFGFAIVYEFIILVFSRNGQHGYAKAFTVLVILLSLASYVEIVKDAKPYIVFGFDVMKITPLFISALPAIAHYVIAEGLVNNSISFSVLSSELVRLENEYQSAVEKMQPKANGAKDNKAAPMGMSDRAFNIAS